MRGRKWWAGGGGAARRPTIEELGAYSHHEVGVALGAAARLDEALNGHDLGLQGGQALGGLGGSLDGAALLVGWRRCGAALLLLLLLRSLYTLAQILEGLPQRAECLGERARGTNLLYASPASMQVIGHVLWELTQRARPMGSTITIPPSRLWRRAWRG